MQKETVGGPAHAPSTGGTAEAMDTDKPAVAEHAATAEVSWACEGLEGGGRHCFFQSHFL